MREDIKREIRQKAYEIIQLEHNHKRKRKTLLLIQSGEGVIRMLITITMVFVTLLILWLALTSQKTMVDVLLEILTQPIKFEINDYAGSMMFGRFLFNGFLAIIALYSLNIALQAEANKMFNRYRKEKELCTILLGNKIFELFDDKKQTQYPSFDTEIADRYLDYLTSIKRVRRKLKLILTTKKRPLLTTVRWIKKLLKSIFKRKSKKTS